jgi:hypothetical protein
VKHANYPRIHTFIATSDIHMQHKLKKSREEVLEITRCAFGLASFGVSLLGGRSSGWFGIVLGCLGRCWVYVGG